MAGRAMIEIHHISEHEVTLTPFGELCGPRATTLIRVVIDLGFDCLDLEISLRQVPFIDAMGLSALATSMRRVRALGGAVRWRDPRPSVRWRIEYCGLGDGVGRVLASVEGGVKAESSSGGNAA
jgi:anti-anti-sigma factor